MNIDAQSIVVMNPSSFEFGYQIHSDITLKGIRIHTKVEFVDTKDGKRYNTRGKRDFSNVSEVTKEDIAQDFVTEYKSFVRAL